MSLLFSLIVSLFLTTPAFASGPSFVTYQPSYMYSSWQETGDAIPIPEGIPNQAEIVPTAINLATKNLPELTYAISFKDEEVTPESIESMGPNQIIIWQGHGNWDEATQTISVETASPYANYAEDPTIITADGYYASLTPAYFDAHLGNLAGSLVYLGSCESGHAGNDALAQVFLDHGASTVIVNTQTIQMMYGNIMQYTTIKLMSEINPTTNNYYTISEALEKAKSIYGKDDHEKGFYPAALGAEPIIFGDTDYRLAIITTPAEPIDNPATNDNLFIYIIYIVISAMGLTLAIKKSPRF